MILATTLYLNQYKSINDVTIVTDPDTYALEKTFYSQHFAPDENKIFLIGSSHLRSLNTTQIEDDLLKKSLNYTVYNLAIASDHPLQRLDTIDMIIAAKPKIILYGIADRDFVSNIPLSDSAQNKIQNILPDLHKLFSETAFQIENFFHLDVNYLASPKLVTFNAVSKILHKDNTGEYTEQYPNTPFGIIDVGGCNNNYAIIQNKESLDKLASFTNLIQFNQLVTPFKMIPPPDKNKEFIALNDMIKKFQQNNMKVIIFVTPQSKQYLDTLPVQYRESFNAIVKELSDNPDVRFYSLYDKYQEDYVWCDLTHVASNKTVTVYPNDVVKMIEKEINP